MLRKSELGLQGYVDADNGGDFDSRKSTFGYVYTFGGMVIYWVSKFQKIFTLSSCEAEYMAITEATNEMICLHTFMRKLDQAHDGSVLYVDSQSAILLEKKPGVSCSDIEYTTVIPLYQIGIGRWSASAGSYNPLDMLMRSVPYDKLKLYLTSVRLLDKGSESPL